MAACPVATTISLLNSQWKILIMRELLLHPSERYSELQHSVAGISQKMLTQSLHEMTADGIVQRQVFPEVPPHVEYRLTELGQSMDPILKAMHNWGNQYLASHPEKRRTNKQPETDFAQKRP
ncbi:winged helix-turn-helix transcriptional regulator [Limosilactobacillus mucosae]|jgi:DNA-binding HxlR family transcriptional regulator|uniref:winged helix-turn-helix transcriptional regulator n=1 Tax=Limosilactobacillus mucosae TaxID=97478 RepID=UPI0029A5FEBD|nr:helix-turn-helix domain-containing protein [Limosilactobacillus mucosae]MDX2311801.1 helix-turn-helix transcriptional regulator [Limosilactobacillus mucosae]